MDLALDYWESDQPGALRNMEIAGDDQEDVQDLIRWAWYILFDSSDLVDWVACLFYERDGSSNCITRRVHTGSSSTNVRLTSGTTTFRGWALIRTIGIGFNDAGTAKFQTLYLRLYQGEYIGWSAEDRALAVVDLAATLFHEVLHVCWHTHNYGSCDRITRAENTLRWALLHRYRDARMSSYAGEFVGTTDSEHESFCSGATQYAETPDAPRDPVARILSTNMNWLNMGSRGPINRQAMWHSYGGRRS